MISKLNINVDGDNMSTSIDIQDPIHAIAILKEVMTLFLEDDIEDGLEMMDIALQLAIEELTNTKIERALGKLSSNPKLADKLDDLMRELLR